ncbi:DUF3168 domain-containing protein [Sphingomonas suaedae]|uniref:DUF3168 domain-containing protein n=1 Tax=Sphingomonas suaedae TaxID=2599297 RepID=A0A518RIT2_9SPHN|nr:DUF3168 domain-containing protein [Sphingomonas suaedae]QDX27376.1 DUF3168 domain-containing protein [Sphingomonas suaedae]
MSAREVLQAACVAALSDALEGVGVFDAPPVRAALPHAVVDEPLLADWSTKDMAGREGRIEIGLVDRGERPGRLRALTSAAEDALMAMDGGLPGGWRIVTLQLVRSRIIRGGDGWVATSDFRVRMLRVN